MGASLLAKPMSKGRSITGFVKWLDFGGVELGGIEQLGLLKQLLGLCMARFVFALHTRRICNLLTLRGIVALLRGFS